MAVYVENLRAGRVRRARVLALPMIAATHSCNHEESGVWWRHRDRGTYPPQLPPNRLPTLRASAPLPGLSSCAFNSRPARSQWHISLFLHKIDQLEVQASRSHSVLVEDRESQVEMAPAGGNENGGDKNRTTTGAQENRGAYVCGVNDLKLDTYKLPETLSPGSVRVCMKAVSICGSDVHYVQCLKIGAYEVKEPMVLGHESAGVVEAVGSEVKDLVPGDRVALEPGVPCWRCSFCRDGLYNLCPEMAFFATPPVHGSLADRVVHPAELCFKLPDGVSLEEGAMCEPLSVGVHACRRARVGPDTRVLIIGSGAIGLVTMLVARAFGSTRVIVADTHSERLASAKNLGAYETVLVSKNPEDMAKEIAEIRKKMGGAIDVSCDCVGSTKSLTTCLETTRSGGRVCVVGMRETDMTLPIMSAISREVDILGVFRYRNTYPLCLDLISSGRVDVKPLITHRYKFSEQDVKDAFEMSAHGGHAIKVMFNL